VKRRAVHFQHQHWRPNSDLSFNLLGPDLDKLSEYADGIIRRLGSNKGIVDVDTTLSNRKPELQVQIDRPKAAHFGCA